jgi:dihydroflavonol-4-reductase
MKIFLTGGTGFIGLPLSRALLKRGWQVTALVRDPTSAEATGLRKLGAHLVVGDVTRREALRTAMERQAAGAQMVFHNAGWYELGVSGAAQSRMRAINVEGTENILSLANELGVPRMVYTSSTTALGDTGGQTVDETFQRAIPYKSFYEQTKAEAHALAVKYQQQGAPVVILCPAQVIGPGDHSAFGWFARLYVRGFLPPAVWAPDSTFTMAHVDDVAWAMAFAAERGRLGETYFVGGEPITMRAIVDVWKRTPGGLKPFIWLPRPLAWLTGALTEPALRLLKLPAFISREVVNASYGSFNYS